MRSTASSCPTTPGWRTPGDRRGPQRRTLPDQGVPLRGHRAAAVSEIVDQAQHLAATVDPGDAFFGFFAYMVEQAAANRGLAEALAGDGYDIEAAAARTGHDLDGMEEGLLTRAQQAGSVRTDVTAADVKALVIGCLARERLATDPDARQRMIAIACAGLRAEGARRRR